MSANVTTEISGLTCSPEASVPVRSATSADSGNGSHDRTKRIQEIIEQIEAFPNPAARTLMHECLQSVLGMYGEGLGHVVTTLEQDGMAGKKILSQLLGNSLLRSLLLIHGLHPQDLETRLKEALDKVRPYMQSHGGNVEIISLEGEVARLRLIGACKTCPSSRITLELAVRKAIEEACPDLAGFEVVVPNEPVESTS